MEHKKARFEIAASPPSAEDDEDDDNELDIPGKYVAMETLNVADSDVFGYREGIAFSPDGSLWAAFWWNKTYLWDAKTGKLLREQLMLANLALSIAISKDNKHVVVGTRGHGFHVWTLSTNVCELCDTLPKEVRVESAFWRLCPDGLPIPDESHIPTAAMRLAIRTHGKGNAATHFTPASLSKDGRFFVWPTPGISIESVVWDLQTNKCRNIILDYPYRTAIAISPDGTFVVIGYDDGRVRLWRWEEGRKHEGAVIAKVHTKVTGLVVSPDNTRVAISFGDARTIIWQQDSFDPDVEFASMKSAAKTS